MKKSFVIAFLAGITLFSCEIEGVKEKKEGPSINELPKATPQENKVVDTLPKLSDEEIKEKVENILPKEVLTEKVLKGGVKITWKKKGSGAKISKFDVIEIDYRNKLEDGTVYDGNHFIKKNSIKYPVGWNQQTKGWDIAITELHVGDEVEIFIPSKLARGKKGIPGRVPPNADNYLSLRVLSKVAPTRIVDGIKVYTVEESKKYTELINKNSKVAIDYFVSSERKPRFDNSYQRGAPSSFKIGDGNIIKGLSKALIGSKKMDKLYIHIPAKEAYGSVGLNPFVKPNEDVFYDLIVSEIYKN